MRRPTCPTPGRARRRSHPGFTLVELLVVVTILVILVGLLVPAVTSSIRRVRITAVQSEVNRIASAVTAFKTQYGSDPPSFIVLYENGGTNGANWDNRSRAIIRQLWPQCNFALTRDINGDGDTNDTLILHGGECLVFFLGGLPVPDASQTPKRFSLLGFSKNPQDPFSRAADANRDKAAYDFDSSRFVDVDNDGMPEFLDSFPGQRRPLVYFSSYDGSGYRLEDYPAKNSQPPPDYDVTIPAHWYVEGGTLNGPPYRAKSFQIISPGPDGEYGPGGPYVPGASTLDKALPAWTRNSPSPALTVTTDDRLVERDNITNFSNGMLVP